MSRNYMRTGPFLWICFPLNSLSFLYISEWLKTSFKIKKIIQLSVSRKKEQ